MATGNPDTVEQWAPLFLRSFKKEQVLDPAFAVTFGHCKLCDATCTEPVTEHMRAHKKELNAYLAKKARAADAKRREGGKKGLKKAAENAAADEAREVIEHLDQYADDDE